MNSMPQGKTREIKGVHDAGFAYVNSAETLAAWIADVRTVVRHAGESPRCCIDTEADSLHHFQEKLCLIQIGFDSKYALIDTLALPDVSPLIEWLDECEVWLHGADYDLTMLRKAYGWIPKTVRDTQIAARLVGHRHFGLAALVETIFGKTLSKASQKEDWSRRPLPEAMLRYAVDDVRYLLPLADLLSDKLRELGREDWFIQSCRSLQDGVASRSKALREDPWRVQGSGRLLPKGLALLKAIWEWRDGIASGRDIPCFRVLSNKQMLEYCAAFEQGGPLRPPGGWRPKWKSDFEEISLRITSSPPQTWPQRLKKSRGKLSDAARQKVELLCQLRDRRALALGIESSLLGSRATLEQVVASPDGIDELLSWQKELLAEGLDHHHEPSVESSRS